MKLEYSILGLDVSTKTIGVSLFSNTGELIKLTHVSPKAKPKPKTKTEELLLKAKMFGDFVEEYKDFNIKHVLIEEPLLRSNNVYTAGTLLRFNGMITNKIYEKLGVVPDYISTYDARKNAFPELYAPNDKGKDVLFGGYPKDIDKKKVIWEKVANLEPDIKWVYNKKGELSKENFDMSDSYTVARAFMLNNGYI